MNLPNTKLRSTVSTLEPHLPTLPWTWFLTNSRVPTVISGVLVSAKAISSLSIHFISSRTLRTARCWYSGRWANTSEPLCRSSSILPTWNMTGE